MEKRKKILIISVALVISVILIVVGAIIYNSSSNEEEISDVKTDDKETQDKVLVLDSEYYNRDVNSEVPESKYGRSLEKATVEIVTGTLTKTSATIKISDKNEKTYEWGPGYRIQVKEGETWKNANILQDSVSFPDVKYSLDENGEMEELLNWVDIYGELTNGIYRIAKPLNDNGYLEAYSNEFTIDDSVVKTQQELPKVEETIPQQDEPTEETQDQSEENTPEQTETTGEEQPTEQVEGDNQ